MAFSPESLTAAQRRILEALAGVDGFYLSGGAALSAGYLRHRLSEDLDLFCPTPDDVDIVCTALSTVLSGAGIGLVERRRAPGFRRYEAQAGEESTVIDVVHEPVDQVVPIAEKPVVDGVRYDALADLIANKLCAALGRAEVKDLVDLYLLSLDGVDLLAHLEDAARKDAGMEPATLAWVLAQAPTDLRRLRLLRPVAEEELRTFRDDLVASLQRRAWPSDR